MKAGKKKQAFKKKKKERDIIKTKAFERWKTWLSVKIKVLKKVNGKTNAFEKN